MKKYALTFALAITQLTVLAENANNEANNNNFNAKNSTIAWDGRDVFLKSTRPETFEIAKEVASKLSWTDKFKAVFYDAPRILYRLKWKKEFERNDYIIDEINEKMAEDYPRLRDHFDYIMEVSNTCTLNPETVALLKEAKEQGYKNVLIGGMLGKRSLEEIKKQHPELIEAFDIVWAPEAKDASDKIITLPKEEAYKLITEQCGDTKIIYISDRQHNLDAAEKANWTAIKFENAEHAQEELIKLGVLAAKIKQENK